LSIKKYVIFNQKIIYFEAILRGRQKTKEIKVASGRKKLTVLAFASIRCGCRDIKEF